MPDEFDPETAATTQDPAEGVGEAADEADLALRPDEPGYVAKRLERLKGQRDTARMDAARKEGELSAMKERLASLEARASAPREEPTKPGPTLDDDLKAATDFLSGVEELRTIAITGTDEEQVAAAKLRLAKLSSKDIAFAHSEIGRVQALKAALESEKKTVTHLDARSAQDAFKERLKLEFGPDAVNSKSDLFQHARDEFRELIQQFPDDSSGAVTWMALERARNKVNRAGRGQSDLDRRRLAIEAGTRREAALPNQIAALQARGDPQSKAKAAELKLGSFLSRLYGDR